MMQNFFQDIFLDWSEVWSLLIPLTILWIKRPKAGWVKPITFYLIVALLFNFCADFVWKSPLFHTDTWIHENFPFLWDENYNQLSNNIFYNLHSISRLLLFAWFFNSLGNPFKKVNRVVPWAFLLFVTVNFIFFKNIRDFSSRELALEAAILLFYCFLYFYQANVDEKITAPASQPHFWVVSGLVIYTAVNFLIFLFYSYLMTEFVEYSVFIWNVHNISYIVLNIFISVALYRAR